MAKQLNIDLSVRADTSQAKQAMLNLQKSLNEIISTRTITINDESINNAKQAAIDLKRHLESATNVNTGKIDLSKFSASLNKSGQSLQELYNNLSQIGPAGQSAFLALSQSIAKADASSINLSSKLSGLMVTLKNTAKWQLSSSLLHGFMGAIQGAYHYAQDLNESLNNIRIVTGQNTDQMAKFAKEANTAAKNLSTTTTEYTDASLIYYQQGLSESEVKERTDATIKLANVSRQSAEEVSSQMTAIWNNFAKAGDNLTYYEDVITALGATTASSSSEIAEGLQKFAAVADTVDLSYEKASAALATVVAETRQSADVVGTAFKTLFARIEGLSLGKTLEDGTDLNKYSTALKTIGVNIKDQSGELKDMDSILDEIGSKWQILSKDQQVALSQTVAGVRQYTQFIALMDNYDEVLKNQKTAESSSGTVDEQAKIYAESWEAARDRVTAAAEEIYDQLLNDKAFISILNGVEKFLGFISNIIDGLGGLKGVLLLIGSILMQQYAKEVPVMMEKMITNIRILTGEEEKRRQAMLKDSAKIINSQTGSGSAEVDMQIAGMKKISIMYSDLAAKRKTLSEAEVAGYENLIKETEMRTQVAQAIGRQVDEIKRETDALETQLIGQMGYSNRNNAIPSILESDNFQGNKDEVNEAVRSLLETEQDKQMILEQQKQQYEELSQKKENLTEEDQKILDNLKKQHGDIDGINQKISETYTNIAKIQKGLTTGADLFKAFKTGSIEIGKVETVLNKVEGKTSLWAEKMKEATNNPEKMAALKKELTVYAEKMEKAGMNTEQLKKDIEDLGNGEVDIEHVINGFKDLGEVGIADAADKLEKMKIALSNLGMDTTKLSELQLKLQQGGQAAEEARAELEAMEKSIGKLPTHTAKVSTGLTQIGSAVMQVSAGFNALINLGNIWSNDDLSAGEKLLQTLTALTTVLPIVTIFTNKQRLAEMYLTAAKILHISGSGGVTAAEIAEAAAKEGSAIATWTLIWPIGVLMAAIISLIAVVWLIVEAFKAWQASTPEGKLKKSEETAKELADAVKEAKDRIKELKEAFDQYNTVVNKLESCTKGTQEWKDALKEVNSQVLQLLENAPELANYLTIDEDGVMRISSEGQKKLTQKTNESSDIAEAALASGNQDVRDKKMDFLASKMNVRAVKTTKEEKTDPSSIGQTRKKQENVTENVSSQVENYINENRDKYAQMTKDQIRNDLNSYFSEFKISSNADDWIKAMEKLTNAVNEDAAMTKAETQAIVSNRLSNNSAVQASAQKADIEQASNQMYKGILEKKLKELDDYSEGGGFNTGWGKRGISQANKVNDQANKVWYEYLEAAGLSEVNHQLVDTQGNDDNRVFVYKDAEGEEQKVSLEEMRQVKASADALKELDEAAEQMTKDFQKLSKSADETDQALESFLTNKNFESASANEVADFSQFVSKDNNGNYVANESATEAYLTEMATKLGYENLDEMAKTYGYEHGNDYIKAFEEQAINVSKAWDDINLEEMGLDKTKGWAKNLSVAAASELSKNFEAIKLGPMGEEQAKDYIEKIDDVLSGLSSEDQKSALESLTKIEWSDYDAFDQMVTIMKKYGKTLDENDPKWAIFIENMRNANSAVRDFSKVSSNLTSVIKILNSLDFGKVIEEKDYETLVAYNSEWKKFFMMQSDGTHKFIGDTESMKKATQDAVRESRKEMAARKQVQDNFKSDETASSVDWAIDAGKMTDSKSVANGGSGGEKVKINEDVFKNKNIKAALEAKGYKEENVSKIIEDYKQVLDNKIEGTAADDAIERMRGMYAALSDFKGEVIDSIEQQEKQNEEMASTATTLDELKTLYDNEEISLEAYDKQLSSLAMSVSSLTELQKIYHESLKTDSDGNKYGLDAEEYSMALKNLANNYDNCTYELLEYQKALASGSSELVAETEALLENSIAIGEMSKALDLEADQVEEQANELISVNKLTAENYSVASKVAVLNQSMNKGVSTLVENWKTYKKTLQSAEKGTEDYAEAALNTKKALAELLGVLDEDYIPSDFLELPGVMDLIDKAVEGDEDAINKLGTTMAKTTVEAMKFKENMKQLGENDIVKYLSADDFEKYKNEVLEGITSLTDAITNGTIKAGEDITNLMDGTGESWIESLNKMAYATGMSVDEMNSLLNELGVQTDVTVKDKEVETTVPEYTTYESTTSEASDSKNTDALGSEWKMAKKSVTVQTGTKKLKGTVSVAQINTGDDVGTAPTITYAGRDNVSTSALTKSDSSSNKSSSSSKTTSAASHTHEVHRYNNEKNAVEGLKDQYERLNKIKDQAFGAGRVQAMELELQKLKQLKKASGDYLDAIVGSGNSKKVAETLYKGGNIGSMISSGELGGTIGSDYRALSSGISASGKNLEYTAKDDAGNQYLVSGNYSLSEFNSMFGSNVNFQLDSYGNLANKDSILNLLNHLQNQENDSYASIADPTAASTTEHNKRLAYLAEMKERIEQYGTTLEDLSTQSEQYLEYISQIQEKNAELITEKLNNGITLSNNTLTRLERAIKILGNDIYKSTEKMAKWFSIKDQNRAEYQKQASLNADAMAEVQKGIELYKQNPLDENAISPAKAAELVKTIEENYANLYEKAVSDIAEKEEKYNEVLEDWKTKISDVTTSITFNIEKLDHLQKVFELLGKSTDYKSLGKIFETQAKGAETNYNVQKAKTDEAKKLYSEHQAHAATLSGTELEEYQKTVLDKDRALLEEFEKEEESAFQSWIEKLQVVHENNINQIYQDYEKALVGEYGSFDNLDKSMERQKSMTEEYLTKTNQLYETNKMLRNLQQDIDKTDSRIAKEKLKNFSDEIEAMRNKEKLTKNDLELAKAKYEVVKAQIALEEAQNAKSTVRLQRDNEGNYGYVYTADQDKISNAEQNLEDKENNYYNIALQQYNDYVEKEMQLRKEYTEQKKALDQAYYEEGSLTLEQYNQACLELDEIFKEKELIYQEGANSRGTLLDQIAATDRAEAWSSMYEDVALKQSLFNDESTGAAQELNQALQLEMQDWDNTRNQLLEEAGLDNKQFQSTINDVTKEIDSLGNQITKDGGLVDQFDEMAVTTEALTLDFVNQYQALLDEANGYLEAANQANNYQNELAQLTQAQLAYNAAVAATPTSSYSGSGSNGYSGDNNSDTSNGISDSNKINGGNNPKFIGWGGDRDYHWKKYSDGSTKGKEKHTWQITSTISPPASGGKEVRYECKVCGMKGSQWRKDNFIGPYMNMPDNVHFKTGGYTGKWPSGKTGMYTGSWNGPDLEENGKLAFLHQKELVLNASDTENLLEAVKFIRQISQSIDLQALNQSQGLSVQAVQLSNDGQILQQEVTIHAEFPNATDHNEIEEAFNNLINKASQYANRY